MIPLLQLISSQHTMKGRGFKIRVRYPRQKGWFMDSAGKYRIFDSLSQRDVLYQYEQPNKDGRSHITPFKPEVRID